MDTILIVDPKSEDRAQLVEMLEKHNYRTLEASNGDQAMQICEINHVSVTIIAHLLDDMDGVELFNKIFNKRPFIRCIFLSDDMNYGLLSQIVETRIDDCLQKPCDETVLLESVAKSLNEIIHWRVRFRSFMHQRLTGNQEPSNDPYDFLNTFGISHESVEGGVLIDANELIHHDKVHDIVHVQWPDSTFVYLDYKNVMFINSEKIAIAVMLKNTLRKCNSDVSIFNLSDFVYELFSSLRLLHKLNQAQSLKHAISIQNKVYNGNQSLDF